MTNYTRQSERMPDSLKKKKRSGGLFTKLKVGSRKRKPKGNLSEASPGWDKVAKPKTGKVATKPKAKPRPKAKKPKTTRRGR